MERREHRHAVNMIRTLVRWLSLTLVVSGLLAVGVLLLLRVTLPQLEAVQDRVETITSTWLQRNVTVGALDFGWSGWHPELIARELLVTAPDTPDFAIQELRIRIDPTGLFSSRPWIHELVARGLDLQLIPLANGAWDLQGWVISADSMRLSDRRAGVRVARQITLESVHLLLPEHAAILGGVLRIDQLLYSGTDGRPRGLAAGRLPPSVGGGFTLGFDLVNPEQRRLDVFAEVEHVQWSTLALLGMWDQPVPPVWTSGRIWLGLQDATLQRVDGEHETMFLDVSDSGRAQYDFSHRFRWLRTPEGSVLHLAAQRSGSGQLRVEYGPVSQQADQGDLGRILQLRGAQVDIRSYHALTSALGLAPPPALASAADGSSWRDLKPSGNLSAFDLMASLRAGRWYWEDVDAVIEDFSMAPVNAFPGLQGIDLSLEWRGEHGEIHLQSENGQLLWPDVFEHGHELGALHASVGIHQAHGALQLSFDHLFLANADLAVDGKGWMVWSEAPYLDLEVQFLRADAANIDRYWPRRFIPPRTRAWLVEAVQGGRLTEGAMIFQGNPRKFPFRQEEGLFDLYMVLSAGRLQYQEGWPDASALSGTLRFINSNMIAENVTARILDSNITSGTIRVDDMAGDPMLSLNAVAFGEMKDFRSYLETTGLAERLRLDAMTAEFSGSARLDLQLALPLHRRNPPPPKAQGTLDLLNVRVDEVPVVGPIEMVRGPVQFASDGAVRAEGLTAVLRGRDLTLSFHRAGQEEPLVVVAEGLQALDRWLTGYPELVDRFRGDAHWRAQLTARSGDHMDLVLTSDLEGLRVDLPAPMGKTAAVRQPLEILWPVLRAPGRFAPAAIRIGDQLRVDLRLAPGLREHGGIFQSAAIAVGTPDLDDFRLPRDGGVDFRLHLPRLDLDGWLGVGEYLVAREIPFAAENGIEFRRLDWVVDEQLHWRGRRMPGLQLNYRMGADGPAFRVVGGWIEGTGQRRSVASLPVDGWVVELDRIWLADGLGEELRTRTSSWIGQQDPHAWPYLSLRIRDLDLGGLKGRDFELDLVPIPDGVQVQHIRLSAPEGDVHLLGDGTWMRLQGGSDRSILRAEIKGDNWGQGLRSMGLTEALQGGKGQADFRLEWPAGLVDPGLPGLSGEFALRLDSGVLLDVEPGAGRLLGLLSLDLIPRRLRLDFRDVFAEGLSFDDLTARGHLLAGDLLLPELRIRSPSALVQVEGRTGLVGRDFDQHIAVVPRLRSTLPVMGALLGGPVTGAVLMIVERVLGLGEQVENAAKVEYFVTGPWSEPRIEARVRAESSLQD